MAIRPKLNRVWTSNNSVARRDPGDAKYLQGWVAEIPTYQVLNYLQYKIDTTMLAQAERGIFEWGDDVSYGVGSLAWDETNKTIYVCTVTNPSKALRPSANLAQWSPSSIQVPRANYDAIVAAINAHIADVTTNPHRVTAAQIGAYNKSELDAIVANYRAMVQAHVTDYNNPHQLTATQVGAVPVTGGIYTGEVTFPTVYLNDAKTAQIVNDGGLYLRNGSYYLGINGSTGNPEAGTAASKSRIVSELNFPDVKAVQEPRYATEPPAYEMSLIKSINILRGAGIFDTFAKEPAYNEALGGAMAFVSPDVGGSGINWYNNTQVSNNTRYTICADYTKIVQDGADGNWQFGFGMETLKVLVCFDGGVILRYRNPSGILTNTPKVISSAVATVGKWSRICVTVAGTTVRIFVDGALIARHDIPGIDSNNRRPTLSTWTKSSAVTRAEFATRSLRIWDNALSNEQVSTL